MSNFANSVEKNITPLMGKISSNKVIKSLTAGMMYTMPLTLGTSLVAIAANFPVTAWTNWLASSGIKPHMTAVIGGTTDIIALFLAFIIAYNYAALKKEDGVTAGVLSLGSFIILMPQVYKVAEGTSINVLQKSYLGGSGVFVSMLCAILISQIYIYLNRKGLNIKLPESVPEMVSKSLSPTFIAMIIFVVVLAVRIVFGYTEYGNVFDFINSTIAKPIMAMGTSPVSIIIIYALCSLLWCFGIHPSSLTSVLMPVFMTAITSNVNAFQAGTILPYLAFQVTYVYIMVGGTGGTLGLAFDMVLFAKSERFKTLGKLAIIPNIFNINEPIIFGAPIIYNPVFMLPMTLSPIVTGSLGLLFVNLGFYNKFNPTVKLPWTMPAPIVHLLQTGLLAAICITAAIIATAIIYYPFFKYADKQALKEEQAK